MENLTHGGINDPAILRDLFGIRFHHFHDVKGRLVATIVTEPLLEVESECGEEMVAVAATICSKKDAPSRSLGRAIALGRLEVNGDDVILMPLSELKQAIIDRTILQCFPGGRRLKLRPRGEFTGVK